MRLEALTLGDRIARRTGFHLHPVEPVSHDGYTLYPLRFTRVYLRDMSITEPFSFTVEHHTLDLTFVANIEYLREYEQQIAHSLRLYLGAAVKSTSDFPPTTFPIGPIARAYCGER